MRTGVNFFFPFAGFRVSVPGFYSVGFNVNSSITVLQDGFKSAILDVENPERLDGTIELGMEYKIPDDYCTRAPEDRHIAALRAMLQSPWPPQIFRRRAR